MSAIKLPFPEYRWRFASATPMKYLLYPEVVLGTLRALKDLNQTSKSSSEVHAALVYLGKEVGYRLAWEEDRNIFRNSGQYWTGPKLLEELNGVIQFTPLGRDLASGKIVRSEFAAITIRTFKIPNPDVYGAIVTAKWTAQAPSVKPFEKILRVLLRSQHLYGRSQAYLVASELRQVVIPLASSGTADDDIARSLHKFRAEELDRTGWDDFTPGSNDPRLTREFLIFLEAYGYLEREGVTNAREKHGDKDVFRIPASSVEAVSELVDMPLVSDSFANNLSYITSNGAADEVARRRVWTQTLSRPAQAKFRRSLLESQERCLLTGTDVVEALEAAHIRPVATGGKDEPSNGLLLRADLHLLYDSGHVRISPEGRVTTSRAANRMPYDRLPTDIDLPVDVSREHLRWRYDCY